MDQEKPSTNRRMFLQTLGAAAGAAQANLDAQTASVAAARRSPQGYPRVYRGKQLAMIAFPLGGVGAGSVSLGGRGQLRDWEIFNKPDKGNSLSYAFPAIWVDSGAGKPFAAVLEGRYLPPYEGSSGLGSGNAPGLRRLQSAVFTGDFPLASVAFQDPHLPVQVVLEAFSPFIPLDAEESGLPVATLRYRVTNPGPRAAKVSIAYAIDNPVGKPSGKQDTRVNEFRQDGGLSGLVMHNPALPEDDPLKGTFALCVQGGDGHVTHLLGWPKGRWWNSPMLYWDDFTADGELGPQPEERNGVGALCLTRTIAPGATAAFPFLIAWRFPNRTPERCGWKAPKGDEKTIIGNHYAVRFGSAWDAARHAAEQGESLERRTRQFAAAVRETTLPASVKESAMFNLSTLVSTTCFRTADGEFHGFEGVNDKSGCCHGNCTHVWNYETSTPFLFPSLSKSLRKAAFGYSLDDAGAMHFRQALPDGKERWGYAAADGQMGQIIKAYLDWQLSGDNAWLQGMWPRVKKAIEFAWTPGGWDADRDGVLEGVQHNTYDVEFYGPNPQCGIYYLAALRAGEEMARAMGDTSAAAEYRRLFESGRRWIDANLFNGEFYVQKVRGFSKSQIASSLRSDMGSDDTEHPDYQVGDGCLVDQLMGEYLAQVAGLGPLVSPPHVRQALQSIYRYNYKRDLSQHDTVQRTFALNDEAALVICDYGKGERPHIPFPYYAEVMTGFEYAAATHMMYVGMTDQGIECVSNIRARYDGERRNPWDEAECGHHYARAMAAWSGVLALSGFQYHAPAKHVEALPRLQSSPFTGFWSAASGWGTFTLTPSRLTLRVLSGQLPCQTIVTKASKKPGSVTLAGRAIAHESQYEEGRATVRLREPLVIEEGQALDVAL